MDASNGCLLRSDGKGGFRFLPNRAHGLRADGQLRSAVLLNGGKLLIVGSNQEGVGVWGM